MIEQHKFIELAEQLQRQVVYALKGGETRKFAHHHAICPQRMAFFAARSKCHLIAQEPSAILALRAISTLALRHGPVLDRCGSSDPAHREKGPVSSNALHQAITVCRRAQ